jgi:hypothetical protein
MPEWEYISQKLKDTCFRDKMLQREFFRLAPSFFSMTTFYFCGSCACGRRRRAPANLKVVIVSSTEARALTMCVSLTSNAAVDCDTIRRFGKNPEVKSSTPHDARSGTSFRKKSEHKETREGQSTIRGTCCSGASQHFLVTQQQNCGFSWYTCARLLGACSTDKQLEKKRKRQTNVLPRLDPDVFNRLSMQPRANTRVVLHG